jgi:hypothetical protein
MFFGSALAFGTARAVVGGAVLVADAFAMRRRLVGEASGEPEPD